MTMVHTPELAAEITLQPWRRFNMDGVILFSDILIVPEGMGQKVWFDDQGPHLSPAIRSKSDLEALPSFDPAKTAFIGESLRLIQAELQGQAALLGFCGTPWTVACYMVEGGSPKRGTFEILKTAKNDSTFIHSLLDRVTEATIVYLNQQIDAGLDVIQLFDSWGGLLMRDDYLRFSLPYIRRIIEAIGKRAPIIVFCKDGRHLYADIASTGCQVISVDGSLPLNEARSVVPASCSIQGNLDPEVLLTNPETIRRETLAMLTAAKELGGRYIANLGHGIIKETPPEHVGVFVETVQGFRY